MRTTSMKDNTQVKMLVRTLGALVAGVRDKYGHAVAKELFQAAIEKGKPNAKQR